MMHDRNDREAIRQDLLRWREWLDEREVDDDARMALRDLISGAERRLAEIEGRPELR